MNEEELKAIEERANKATRGPWNFDLRVGCVGVYPGEQISCFSYADTKTFIFYRHGICDDTGIWHVGEQDKHDALYIAHARTDIPRLIAEVRRLQEENNDLLQENSDLRNQANNPPQPMSDADFTLLLKRGY